MEHEPWVGTNYDDGIDGQKVLIVAFSHWGDVAEDNPSFTEKTVDRWASGDENHPFCSRIRDYFRSNDPGAFWNSVAFANSLPTMVGDGDNRYSRGTPEQRQAVPARAYHLIEDLKPDRVFVFSNAAWRLWPDYTGRLRDGTLRIEDGREYDAGSYRHEDGEAIAFGFSHPQYTPVEPTTRAVAAALKATIEDLRPDTTIPDAPPA